MSYFDETLKDWVRTQQAGLGASSQMNAAFNARNRKIIEMLGGGISPRNVNAIIRRVHALDRKVQREIMKTISTQMADVANITIRNEAGNLEYLDLSATTVRSMSTVSITNKVMSSQLRGNKTVGDMMNDVFGSSSKTASNIIRRSVTEGITGREVNRMLREQFDVTSRHLETVTATAMNATANEARNQFYINNSDVVSMVMWRSTLDGKTSDVCQSLDGQVWNVDEPHPVPPAHPNCRSFLVPVIDGMTADEARNMMRPGVSDGVAKRTTAPTYGDWLQRQSAGFQKQVLGQDRYEMLRDGKVKYDQFFAKDGRRLTIDELNNKY